MTRYVSVKEHADQSYAWTLRRFTASTSFKEKKKTICLSNAQKDILLVSPEKKFVGEHFFGSWLRN